MYDFFLNALLYNVIKPDFLTSESFNHGLVLICCISFQKDIVIPKREMYKKF